MEDGSQKFYGIRRIGLGVRALSSTRPRRDVVTSDLSSASEHLQRHDGLKSDGWRVEDEERRAKSEEVLALPSRGAQVYEPIYRGGQSAITPIIDPLLAASPIHSPRQLPDHGSFGPLLSNLRAYPAYNTRSCDKCIASFDVCTAK